MRKLIAKTDEWRAYLDAENEVVEIERADSTKSFLIPIAELKELSRVLAKADGYLNLKSRVILPSDLLLDEYDDGSLN